MSKATKAKVRKRYSAPATSCDRLLAHPSVDESAKEQLKTERLTLDPLDILHRARDAQAALAALGSPDPTHGPGKESLDKFLAQLAELWRSGEPRATHRKAGTKPRDWRTRKDPFETLWAEILLRLQETPEATAKDLFERVKRDHPGQFHDRYWC